MAIWIWASSALPARRAAVFWSPSSTAAPAGQEKWLSLFTLCWCSSCVCMSGSSIQLLELLECVQRKVTKGVKDLVRNTYKKQPTSLIGKNYSNTNTGKKTPYITFSLWRNSLWLWNVCDFLTLKSSNFIYYFHKSFRTWRQTIYLKVSTSWSFKWNIWPLHFFKGLELWTRKVSNQE